jgi:hypothetical protein
MWSHCTWDRPVRGFFVFPAAVANNLVNVQLARDLEAAVPCLMDVKPVKPHNNAEVLQFVGHVFLHGLLHFVEFLWSAAEVAKLLTCQRDTDKSIVCFFHACFMIVIICCLVLLVVTFEAQAWFLCATFESFVCGENALCALMPESWCFRLSLECLLDRNSVSFRVWWSAHDVDPKLSSASM